MKISTRILIATASILCAALILFAAAPQYKVTGTFPIASSPDDKDGWDYLLADSGNNRIFISHGTHTIVVDGSGKKLGDIPDTQGVHGIALAPDLGKGWTSNGRANTLTVFDYKSLQTTGSIPAGTNPDAILYDPVSKRVFAFNGRSQNATVADGASGNVAATIALDGKPETGVSDGKGHVYVNIEDKSEISEIDAKELKVTNTWKLDGCEEPSGLAMDQKTRRLFAGCGNKVMAVVDADSGKVIATPAIGPGVDACGFDPDRKLAFASTGGDGKLTVIQEDGKDKFTVVQNADTAPRARTMTVDTKTHTVYTVTADFNPPAAPTADQPRPRPTVVPGSFKLIAVGGK